MPIKSVGGGAFKISQTVRAYRSSSQTINNATYTIVIFNTENYDDDSIYNNTTGVLTPSATGYFIINWALRLQDLADGAQSYTALFKNNSENHRTEDICSSFAAHDPAFFGSVLLKHDTIGDYYTIKIYHNHGSSRTLSGITFTTWLSVAKIADL